MAEDFSVTIDVERFRTKKQQKLLAMLNDDNVRANINLRIKNDINKYVPKKSGKLRKSARVTPDSITWSTPYARYQYYGEVYGPNHPIMHRGVIVGWYSTPGMAKTPTGRELGVPGYWKGWRFGYTTHGTHHHWDEYFQMYVKMKTNQKITRYLKRECKRRGLNK